MNAEPSGHDPVLLAEVLELLQVGSGKTFVDCTLGRGGHALAIAGRLGPEGLLIGMDADPRNLEYAGKRLEGCGCRLRLFHANFAELENVLDECGLVAVDGILADLGLSTNQILDPAYGLSFSSEALLDMRIDPRTKVTAADIVNRWQERDIADLLFHLADERGSRRIARRIVERRAASPIRTTVELAQLVYDAIGRPSPRDKINPATRTFMALRMAVNAETENLEHLLVSAPKRLRPGGRLGIISFQSTEDRLVKLAFRTAAAAEAGKAITRKPVVPGEEEMDRNPRSRSAKLRVLERM